MSATPDTLNYEMNKPFLKIQIAVSCNNNIVQYCDEKGPFIKQHEKQAVEWYALNGPRRGDA